MPADKLHDMRVSIIGVGAVGRQVALMLASIGVRNLQLIDFDSIELSNVTTQGYLPCEIGQLKVNALRAAVKAIDPSITCAAIPTRFTGNTLIGEVVFCCVDSISTRKAIWRALKTKCHFWVDGRMLGETIRILAACNPKGLETYEKSFFEQSEAAQGSCTARSTIYAASITAGLMVQQFVRWLRDQPTDCDLLCNLTASEMVVDETEPAYA